eukprot:1601162-Rhodomonas_salina.3
MHDTVSIANLVARAEARAHQLLHWHPVRMRHARARQHLADSPDATSEPHIRWRVRRQHTGMR